MLFSLLEKDVWLPLANPEKETLEIEVQTLGSSKLSIFFFLYDYRVLSLFKRDRRRHRHLLDKYSRGLAQSLHLRKWIGDWETGVGVEKEKLSSHNVLFLFEFFRTTCM